MKRTKITPGGVWTDTDGKRIQAHGGSILPVGGTYYWYGENKEFSTPGSTVWHWGVRCYSSTDLMNWHDEGVIIRPDEVDRSSPLHPEQWMDRPHILYNAETEQFVCWVKVMSRGWVQRSTVLTAPSILGPWTIQVQDLRPLDMNAGDFDLVVDPTDGKGYYYFERVHSELICADLTSDYTGVTGYYSTHFPQPQPPFVREAPAHFQRRGLHYLLTSGTTGYYPNPSEAAVARSYHGPFQALGDLHPSDASGTSFHSQISSVFRHPKKRDLYIALADRWLPAYLETGDRAREIFTEHFDPERVNTDPMPDLAVVDTSIADYVWLPLRFDGDRPYIDWVDEWSPDDFD